MGSILFILPVQASGMWVAYPSGSRLSHRLQRMPFGTLDAQVAARGLPRGQPERDRDAERGRMPEKSVNRHSTVTHYQRPNMTHPQEGGTGGEVSEILFFSAKSKRRPRLIYSMQIIPVCLSIVARRKGVSATRRGGLNWTPISLLVGHPCKLFHRGASGQSATPTPSAGYRVISIQWQNSDTIQSKQF